MPYAPPVPWIYVSSVLHIKPNPSGKHPSNVHGFPQLTMAYAVPEFARRSLLTAGETLLSLMEAHGGPLRPCNLTPSNFDMQLCRLCGAGFADADRQFDQAAQSSPFGSQKQAQRQQPSSPHSSFCGSRHSGECSRALSMSFMIEVPC